MKRWLNRMASATMLLTAVFMLVIAMNVTASNMKPKKLTIYAGSSVKISKTGISGKKTWQSSNPEIAAVSRKGNVQAKAPGSVMISAKSKNRKYRCRITVLQAPVLSVGKSMMLRKSTSGKAEWKSFNKSIVKISGNGKITALKSGNAVITIKQKNIKTKVYVRVINTPSSGNMTNTVPGKNPSVSGTAGASSEAEEMKKYDYDISIINPRKPLYSRCLVGFHIKTDNPEKSTIHVTYTGTAANGVPNVPAPDVNTKEGQMYGMGLAPRFLSTVSDGYLYCMNWASGGNYSITVSDNFGTCKTFDFTIADYFMEEQLFIQSVLNETFPGSSGFGIKNTSDPIEKMNAVRKWASSYFSYNKAISGTYVKVAGKRYPKYIYLLADEAPYWVTRLGNCGVYAEMMTQFGYAIGFDKDHCYVKDASDKTGASPYHVACFAVDTGGIEHDMDVYVKPKWIDSYEMLIP